MQGVLDWLTALPPAVLYLVLAIVAAVENVFPPIPADTVVAFGAFLAARGHATLAGAFLATLGGNTAGAMGMYAAGRRFGAERLARRLDAGAVSVKGKTNEHMGFVGREEGLACIAVATLLPGAGA